MNKLIYPLSIVILFQLTSCDKILSYFNSANEDSDIKIMEEDEKSKQEEAKAASVEEVRKDEAPAKSIEKPEKTNANSNSGFFASGAGLYPEGSQRYLSEGDVAYLSKRDLKIMRNEIFARHGYIFKTNDMMQYFNSQSWYKPLYNDVTNSLSEMEVDNVNFIKRYE